MVGKPTSSFAAAFAEAVVPRGEVTELGAFVVVDQQRRDLTLGQGFLRFRQKLCVDQRELVVENLPDGRIRDQVSCAFQSSPSVVHWVTLEGFCAETSEGGAWLNRPARLRSFKR
jgi:hypothetical protein